MEFPDDGKSYEIHALGGLTPRAQDRKIDVFLVPSGSTPGWQEGDRAFTLCPVSLGVIHALEIGSVWKNGHFVGRRPVTASHGRFRLRRVRMEDPLRPACRNADHAGMMRVFQACHRLPYSVFKQGWSAPAEAEVGGQKRLVVFPCPVIFSSLYGATKALALRLLRPLPDKGSQWERAFWLDQDADGTARSFIDPFTGEMTLCLSSGLGRPSCAFVAMFRQDQEVRRRAKHIAEAIWAQQAKAHLRAELPFSEPCDMEVVATNSAAGLIIHRIISTSYAIPGVESLKLDFEFNSSPAPNQGGVRPRSGSYPGMEATNLEGKEFSSEHSARAGQSDATWLVAGTEWPFHPVPVTRLEKEHSKYERKPPPKKDDSKGNLVASGEATHEQTSVPGVQAQRSADLALTANLLEMIALKPGFLFIKEALNELSCRGWTITCISGDRCFFSNDGRADNLLVQPRFLGLRLQVGAMRALLFEGPTFFSPTNRDTPHSSTSAVLCRPLVEEFELTGLVAAIHEDKDEAKAPVPCLLRAIRHRWQPVEPKEQWLAHRYYAMRLANVVKEMHEPNGLR